MIKTQFTRKELYDLVWLEPLTSVAKKFNVPAGSLRKICKQMEIPVPAVGFWMKKHYGKSVVVVPLDENYKGVDTVNLTPVPGDESTSIPLESPLKIKQRAIEEDQSITLKIPERAHKLDPLITQYKQNLITRKQKDNQYPILVHKISYFHSLNSCKMNARLFYNISFLHFEGNGIARINEGVLYLTNQDELRPKFLSENVVKEYGESIKRYAPKNVFGYSEIQLSQTGILSPSQFNKEYLEIFDLGIVHMHTYINMLWFIKDNSVGLWGVYGEIIEMKQVNGVSKTIVNYNAQGGIDYTTFNQDQLKEAGLIAVKLYDIFPKRKIHTEPTIIYERDANNKQIRGIKPKVPETFEYSDQTSLERALYFLVTARNQNYLIYKIAFYMPIFECLFIAQGVTEITYKMSLRVAYYIGQNETEREGIFQTIKKGYDIRSRFLHGQEFEISSDDKEPLLKLSSDLDSILRKVFLKIINEDAEVFIKYNSKERESFLNNIIFGLPFDYATIRANINRREEDRQRTIKMKLDKKERASAQNKNKIK